MSDKRILGLTINGSNSIGVHHHYAHVYQCFAAPQGAYTHSPAVLVLWSVIRGDHESRRCSRDTYPESYITKYTAYTKTKHEFTCVRVLVFCGVQRGPGTESF